MTDEEVEKIIKRNMNLQMNLAGIRADFEKALQHQWVGLTDEEIQRVIDVTPDQFPDYMMRFAWNLQQQLKEKNNG